MIVAPEKKVIRQGVRGELGKLVLDLDGWEGPRDVLEILVEGPRGTSKSRTLVHFLHRCCANLYPGCKVLVVRKTRQSLTDSFCKTFEEDVIPDEDRQAILGDGDRSNRSHYQYPNGSRIVLAGLDKPTKYQSTDWDIVFLEEASELTWKQVEPFFGALRQFTPGIPWQLMLAATNPDAPSHWLNQRAEHGLMRRVKTHHRDNPKWYGKDRKTLTPEGASFLRSLERYTGVARKRHVEGIWCGAEGMVWENYDPETHLVAVERNADHTANWKPLGLKDFFGSMDWGFTAPGSLSIWGRDCDKRLVRVAGVYKTKQPLEWWAERVFELDREFGLTRVVCDPSRPDAIALCNDYLRKRDLPMLCTPADNKKASSTTGDLAGLDLVRWGLEKDATGTPRIRFIKDALRFGRDPELIENNQPNEGYDELPGYVFGRDAQGEILDDRTDPDCPDHFADELRYASAENWKRGAPDTNTPKVFKPGTMGFAMRHNEALETERRHRPMRRRMVV